MMQLKLSALSATVGILLLSCAAVVAQSARLMPQRVTLKSGRAFALNLPAGFEIMPAVEGLKRVRFFARSPDGRLFVTDMYNLTDNRRGAVYILDEWDAKQGKFGKVIPYLANLRNPNSVAFYTDEGGADWLYLALTDKLVRYRFTRGETKPTSAPETLATFPDYGLDYKYGGWHLTRTIAVGANRKIYVAVGSSCNACIEKEDMRATVLEMNPDGSSRRIYAKGLRNAVGLKFVGSRLIATNQGADHLGQDKPNETMYDVRADSDYGWPHCYQSNGRVSADPKFPRRVGCGNVPRAFAAFPAHSSALGFDYFQAGQDRDQNPASNYHPLLQDVYLVALHGSTNKRRVRGYRIAHVNADGRSVTDFVTGFLDGITVNGRPCDILRVGADAFLFTDDNRGVIYYVRRKSE